MAPLPKTVLLTGATGSIGREIALGLADKGCELILAVRDEAKAAGLVQDIKARCKAQPPPPVHVEKVDMSSLASMRSFVSRVNDKYPRLDCLINNAAIVPASRQLTVDGLETQFAVNILSYVCLMLGLSKLLKRSAPARVVNVASNLAGDLDLGDLHFEKRAYDKMTAYKQAKQANRMLSHHAAAEVFGDDGTVAVHAMHPGVTTSNVLVGLGYEKGWDTAEQCAKTAIHLALDEGAGKTTGGYWVNCEPVACQWQDAKDENRRLWQACARLTGLDEAEGGNGGSE